VGGDAFLFEFFGEAFGVAFLAFHLEFIQQAVGTVELKLEAAFVAVEVVVVPGVWDLFGGEERPQNGIAFLIGRGFFVEWMFFDFVELEIDSSGFGSDDAPVSPATIGDDFDDVFLESGMGFQFHFEVIEEFVVILLRFGPAGGIDDDIIGGNTEFHGVFG